MKQTLRILHIDAQPGASASLSSLLSREGLSAEVQRVDQMAAFQEALEHGGYDLIISDHSLPGVDPREALRLAQSRRPEVPFVFLSPPKGQANASVTSREHPPGQVQVPRLGSAVIRALQIAADEATRPHANPEFPATEDSLRLQSAALRSAANGISITDSQGIIIWVNPAFERLTGYPAAELVGQTHRLLKSHQHTETFYRELWETILAGHVWHGEVVNRRKDGTLYSEEMTIAPVKNARGHTTHYVAVKQDVTGRKLAEERLQQSERDLRRVHALSEVNLAQLRDVIATMTEGLAVFDPHGNLLDINPAGLALHGFDSVHDMQRHFHELRQILELRDLAGNVLTAEQWPIARALRGETFTAYQLRVRRLDSSREWFASYGGAPVRDAQGRIILGIVTLHDITELRRAHAALAGRIEQQEILSQALVDLLSTEHPRRLVRDLFPRVAAHLDADTYFNFLVGDDAPVLHLNAYSGVSPEAAGEINRLEFGQAICGTVAQTREPIFVAEVQHSHDEKTALIRDLGIQSYVCFPLLTGGRLLGTLSFASHTRTNFTQEAVEFLRLISNYAAVALDREQTLHALRESERQFRGTFENAAVGIANVGPDGRWLAVNQTLCEIVGYRRDELLQRTFQSITYPDDLGTDLVQFDKLQRGEINTYSLEKRYVHKQGHPVWIYLTVGSTRDEQGQLLYYISVIQDITDRKRAEEALRRSEERHRVLAEELQAIMDAAPEGLLVAYDPHCRVITGNATAHELFGVPIHENISATPGPQQGSSYFKIYRKGREANGAELPMQVAGATGNVVHDEELEVVRHDGQRRTIMVTAAPLHASDGSIRGAVGAVVDITAHKQAEAALRRAHERTETILNSITDAFFAFDRQWRFTYVNAEAERVLRRPSAELVGRRYSDLFPQAEAFEAQYARVLATGQSSHFEEFYSPLQTWFECHAYPAPEGLAVYFRDISPRKKVEHALQESEAKFRAIFEQAAIGIGRVSFANGRWIDANDAFCRMLGYTRQELCAIPWPDMTHPDDLRLDLLPFRRMAAGEIDSYSVEKRFIHKSGHHIWARLTLSLVRDPEGRPEYEIAVIENITDRLEAEATLRRAEHQFRALAESIPQLVWTANPQGHSDYFNERWCAYTGLTPEQSPSGWFGVVHPDDRAATFERWMTAIASGQPYQTEYRLRRQDGQYRWFLGRGVPLRDSSGAVERWFGTCTDIDEHKRTLEALQESRATLALAKDELARANRRLDQTVRDRTAKLQETIAELEQMSYSMIHDLRAPLRTIRSFGDIIAEDPGNQLTAESRTLIENMITAADRMDHLVRDVLNYGRVIREELPLGPVDVGPLARGIVETYPNLRSSGAEVRVDPDFPVVIGNAAALTQCLSQLLDNAVKFARPGQPPKVHIHGEQADHGLVRIVVQDNGIGIAPEFHQKVFGLFQQLGKTAAGTGMGLAIVKKAVERMGGRVGVDPVPGQGSRFWIELKSAAAPVHRELDGHSE